MCKTDYKLEAWLVQELDEAYIRGHDFLLILKISYGTDKHPAKRTAFWKELLRMAKGVST